MNVTLSFTTKFEENEQFTIIHVNFAHFKHYCVITYSDCAFFIQKIDNTAQAAFVMVK